MVKQTKNNSDNIIPHSRPTIGPEEANNVAAVIRSGQIGQGSVVGEFEEAFCSMLGIKYAAATNSGTSALHLALLGMGVGKDDEVIIPSYVCTALINAVHYTGARPVLADIDPKTYNIDPEDVKKRLTKKTRAIIVPHMFGLPADLERLLALDVPIIEDCAQAVGSTYQNKPVGTFGQAAVFSFYATKVMTTGEGGMVVSNRQELIERVKDHRAYDQRDHYSLRYNYKMTDMNAAMGMAQLKKLESFIKERRNIAAKYDLAFQGGTYGIPQQTTGSIYFRYILNMRSEAGPWIEKLRAHNVFCARPVYYPLHLYQNAYGYSHSEQAWRQSLSIPIYPSLSDEDLSSIIETLTGLQEQSL